MAAGVVGSVWATDTWSDTAWEADTWADAAYTYKRRGLLLLGVGSLILRILGVRK